MDISKKHLPEDKTQTKLQNWTKFEEQYPTTFAGVSMPL